MTPTTPTTSRGRTMMISGKMKRARLVNARWKATRSDRALGNERGEGGGTTTRDDARGAGTGTGTGTGTDSGEGTIGTIGTVGTRRERRR